MRLDMDLLVPSQSAGGYLERSGVALTGQILPEKRTRIHQDPPRGVYLAA